MADISRTIEIIFGAVDNTGGAISSIGSDISAMSDGVSTLTAPLSNLADDLLKAEVAILALGAAMLGVAVNESAKLQSSVNEIGTLFNATPQQIDKMRASIQGYGADSVFTFDDITKATYDMVSATGDAENSVSALKEAERLAVVGNTDLGTATNALTTIINAYGLDLDKSADVTGAFFTAVQSGKTTLPELEQSIGGVAASAAASKVPFDDLLAGVAALTGGGIQTSQAMTGLTAILSELAKPSVELAAALGGVNIETAGLQGVMQKLQTATSGSFVEMSRLFGSVEATKSALVLGSDAAGVFEKTLSAMGDKSTVVSKNFSTMEGNLGLVTQNMQNNLTIALQNIGSELLPGWTDIVKSVGDIFKGVNISIDDGVFDDVFKALSDFEIAVSRYLSDVAKVLPEALDGVDFSGLIESFGGLGGSIGGIFGDLDFTKADDLKTAIRFVVKGFTSLNKVVSGIVEAWKPALHAIAGFVKEFNTLDAGTQQAAGKLAGYAQIFEAFKGAIIGGASALDTIGTALSVIAGSSALTALSTIFPAISSSIAGFSIAGAGFVATSIALATAAGVAGYALGTALQEAIKTVTGDTETLGEKLGGAIYDFFHSGDGETTSTALSNVAISIDDAASKTDNAQQSFSQLAEKLGSAGLNADEAARYFGILDGTVAATDASTVAALKSMGEYGKTAGRSSAEIDKLLKSVYGTGDVLHDGVAATVDGTNALTAYGQSAKDVKKPIDDIKRATVELTESQKLSIQHSYKMEEVLTKLANNEKIKAMEFTAEIKVAGIQAQADIVVAAYQSISTAVESTSKATSDIWGLYSEKAAWVGGDELEAAALRQEDRQQDALNLQRDLTNAQIETLNAQARSLNNGGSQIKIDAGNLAPELQQVLRSLIDNIRIEAVNNGLEILQ